MLTLKELKNLKRKGLIKVDLFETNRGKEIVEIMVWKPPKLSQKDWRKIRKRLKAEGFKWSGGWFCYYNTKIRKWFPLDDKQL